MTGALDWLTTGANWTGASGVWARLLEHLWYTMLALVIAIAIALPLGAVIGHTGKFTIKQTDFGIKPVSVGGVVKVKDELAISFTIVARER